MRIMELVSGAPKPNTSKPCKMNNVYPYLLRGMDISRPNQVWCSDLTYIRMPHGFVYLTAVMDWYSRFVLSWELSVTMDNIMIERLWRSVEYEEVYLRDYASIDELKDSLKAYF